MRNRILEIRKDYKLNQDQFAERLKLTKNFVSLIETGNRVPSDRTIADICREFNVNEEWLRTGKGEKLVPLPMEESLMNLFADVSNEDATFKKALLSVMSRMSLDEWKMLEAKAVELLAEMQK